MEIVRETNAASLTDTPLDLYAAQRTAQQLHMQNDTHRCVNTLGAVSHMPAAVT